jgi:hypothetical protein
MTKVIDIKVGEVKAPLSPEEALAHFDSVVENYKTNPKYESRKAELEAQRAVLAAAIKPAIKPVEPVEPKVKKGTTKK